MKHYDSGIADCQETVWFSAAFQADTWISPKHPDIYERGHFSTEALLWRQKWIKCLSSDAMERQVSLHVLSLHPDTPYQQKWWVYNVKYVAYWAQTVRISVQICTQQPFSALDACMPTVGVT